MGDQLDNIADEQHAGAFRALFQTFWPRVTAMLMRQGADRKTAEAIAEETMLVLWRKSPLFPSDTGRVAAWIYAKARDLRIGRMTGQAVWQRYHDACETARRLRAPAGPAPCREQHRAGIERALGGLPPDQLQVLQLSFVEGLSPSRIAARLDLPLGTVNSRMRLAFEKLRASVEHGE